MLTLQKPHLRDPLPGWTRAQHRRWRRAADQIITDHRREVAVALRGLAGTPVTELHTERSGTLRVEFPSQTLTVGGIAPSVAVSAERLHGIACHVATAGAYGRFWWLIVAADPPVGFRLAILGSHIRLAPQPDPLEPVPSV